MMPVAALAACGIILGITSALLKTQVQDAVPFLTASSISFLLRGLLSAVMSFGGGDAYLTVADGMFVDSGMVTKEEL